MSSKRKKVKIRLSASKINTYKQCPRRYYYNYIKKLPRQEWPHTLKGNLAHDVLEYWVKNGIMKGKDPAASMKEAFTYLRQNKYNDMPEEFVEEVVPWLKAAVKNFKEQKFTPVEAEQDVHFTYRGILMRGRLDRIDQVDDSTIEIVDYKSSKDPKWLTPQQLGFYQIAVQFGNLSPTYGGKDVEASYVLLRHDMQKKPYTFKPKRLDQFLDTIEEAADSILHDTKWEPKPSPLCQTCDFFVACNNDPDGLGSANAGEWSI